MAAAVGLHRARPGEVEGLELTEKMHVERSTGDTLGGVHGHEYTVTAHLAGALRVPRRFE